MVEIGGCRDGWIAVVWPAESIDVRFRESIHELHRGKDVVAAVSEIPLGFSVTGDRHGDVFARGELRARASPIFSAPARMPIGAR